MITITFITGNPGKVLEVKRFLNVPIEHQALELDEIQSLDLEAVVKDKAARAFAAIGKPVLVEDVSFVCTALGKLPGPFIKWFVKELGNKGLCRLLDGKDRSCAATVCYGLCDGKQTHLFSGSMDGSVAENPRGDRSFGWADIFIPAGSAKTYAEMTDEEQALIAMRNKALAKLCKFLDSQK